MEITSERWSETLKKDLKCESPPARANLVWIFSRAGVPRAAGTGTPQLRPGNATNGTLRA